MILIESINLKILPEEEREAALKKKIKKLLRLSDEDSFKIKILKESIDARDKNNIFFNYKVLLSDLKQEEKLINKINRKEVKLYKNKEYEIKNIDSLGKDKKDKIKNRRIYIIGAGPAGLFCALYLSLFGLSPVVIERGNEALKRKDDVYKFLDTGILNLDSNVLFGEGGAGTFSDGKLNTQIKDKEGRFEFILNTFVCCGADERIKTEAKPHIGTDELLKVIPNLRKKLLGLGCEFRFSTKLTDIIINNDRIEGIVLNDNERADVDDIILATGHSARDTFKMLYLRGLNLSAKDFSVGFRIEHPSELINKAQYGSFYKMLPPSSYKLSKVFKEKNRGIYSFCMCPGGKVINSSSEENMLSVNGMSESKRDGRNSNSAVVISVDGREFDKNDPLSGIEFQRRIERRAYDLLNGRIPQQRLIDFKNNTKTKNYNSYDFKTDSLKNTGEADLRGLLPEGFNDLFLAGIEDFSKKIEGFDSDFSILSGIESRTSSPVRIERDKNYNSNISGIYPCGEGAGFAGGIMSAAVDGLKTAERLIINITNNE